MYADGLQLYFPFSPEMTEVNEVHECLTQIKDGLASDFLQLNDAKTEVLIVAPDSSVSQVTSSTGSLGSNVRPKIRNLGLIFNQAMHLDELVKKTDSIVLFPSVKCY